MKSFLWQPSPVLLLKHLLLLTAAFLTLLVLAGWLYAGDPVRFGDNSRFPSDAGALQFWATSLLCFEIFTLRRRQRAPGAPIWALIALGFGFLGFDEVFAIHNRLDDLIHTHFGLIQTALSDRLDDAIVLLYGLLGVGALAFYREEIRRFRALRPYLAAGFACFVLAVACNAAGGRHDLAEWLAQSPAAARFLFDLFGFGDEAFKLFGGVFFFCGFYEVRHSLKNPVLVIPVPPLTDVSAAKKKQ